MKDVRQPLTTGPIHTIFLTACDGLYLSVIFWKYYFTVHQHPLHVYHYGAVILISCWWFLFYYNSIRPSWAVPIWGNKLNRILIVLLTGLCFIFPPPQLLQTYACITSYDRSLQIETMNFQWREEFIISPLKVKANNTIIMFMDVQI